MEKTEKKEVTLEELQKQVAEVTSQIKTLQDENTQLKEQITQKDLEITKLSMGGITKVTKEVQEEKEDILFDFDF